VATGPGNKWATWRTRVLDRSKVKALQQNHGDYDRTMNLSEEGRIELEWWLENVAGVCQDLWVKEPDVVIKTDASNDGWGAYDPASDRTCGSRWSEREQGQHINCLELLAVKLALCSLCPVANGQHIRILTDNTTTMSCINKQGSVKSDSCNRIACEIWSWARERQVWLSAAHIPGVSNVEADQASRKFNEATEWTLARKVFGKMCDRLGQPEVDWFASRLNYKIKPYFAWQPDPEAEGVDSLSVSWRGTYGYAFPPFTLIGAVLQKLRQDEAELLLVFPYWPTRSWFSMIPKMLVAQPYSIQVTDNVLSLPCSAKQHPMTGKLVLVAARLSGEPTRVVASRKEWFQPCSRPAGLAHINSTNGICPFGKHFVLEHGLICIRPL
jgi:hypothetical protein